MRTKGLLAGLVVLGFVTAAARAASPAVNPRQPNIVLLISDDDDYENFGFMGNPRVHTPALDRLARDGTVFTTAHVAAPLCRPSLASMLSGRLPHQNGIYSNYMERAGIGNDTTKLATEGSLPNQLKAAGYATYLAGSKYWEGDPRAMGFTHGVAQTNWEGFLKLVRKGQEELWQFIDEEHGKRPMFIWWAPMVPHTPHNPPEKYDKFFAHADVPIPLYYRGNRDEYVRDMRKLHAMEAWFDGAVGEFVDKLREAGEYDNTLFLFYVDNGWTCGTPAKNFPSEKGLRTPMIVTWPGHLPAGRRIDSLTRSVDLYATMLDYAGAKVPEGSASRSLRPLIEARTDRMQESLYGAVYAHHAWKWQGDPARPASAARDVYALYGRDERWKYELFTQDVNPQTQKYLEIPLFLCPLPERRRGEENLFDLRADPYEIHNLAGQPEHRQRLAAWRIEVLDWWRTTGGGPLEVSAATSPASP